MLIQEYHSDTSSVTIDGSVLEEYWDDFDEANRILEEKKDFKFVDLDEMLTSDKQIKKFELEIFKEFDPDNPPLLKHYETLNQKYKLPSRRFLELERDGYRAYIKMLKKVNKVLVKRAKNQARETAKRIVMNHTDPGKQDFDEEIGKPSCNF